MVYDFLSLAAGRLASVTTNTVYTVAAERKVVLRSIVLVNSGAVPVSLNLLIGRDGTDLYVLPKDLTLAVGHKYDDNSAVVLPAGSTLKLQCLTSGASLDFHLSGVLGA